MAIPGQVTGFETGLCERLITAKFQPIPTATDINNVYVNSATGFDQWPGTGSSDAPYRTIERAMKDLGNVGVLDVGRIVLQNAGPHEIPENYVFPAQTYSDRITEGAAFSGFTDRAPLVIVAAPVSELAIPVLNITAQNLNTTSNLVDVVTNLVLTPGEFAGLFVQDANGVIAAILDNDATTLEVAHSGALTGPLTVYSRLATIEPEDSVSAVPTMWFRGNSTVILQGVTVQQTTGGALKMDGGARVYAQGCEFESVVVGDDSGAPGFFVGEASTFLDVTARAGRVDLWRSVTLKDVSGGPGCIGAARETRADGAGTPLFSDAIQSCELVTVTNCELTDCGALGLLAVGSELVATAVLIEGASVAGVGVLGNGLALLTTVAGVNDGNGLFCSSGGVAVVAASVTIQGAAGADFRVEGLAAISAANFRGGTAPFSIKGPGGSAILQGNDTGNPRVKAEVLTTTPLNLTGAHQFVFEDATAGNKTVVLPASAVSRGRSYLVMKTDGGSNFVSVTVTGADEIVGLGSIALTQQYQFIWVVMPETGVTWYVVSQGVAVPGQAPLLSYDSFSSGDSPVAVGHQSASVLSGFPDAGNVVFELPQLATVRGRTFFFLLEDAADDVILTPAAGETINFGDASLTLPGTTGNISCQIFAPQGGTDWKVLSYSVIP